MKFILINIFCVFFYSFGICQDYSSSIEYKYPLKTIALYCQTRPEKSIDSTVFSYDENKRLNKHSIFFNGVEHRFVLYKYNDNGLLITQEFYESSHPDKIERVRIFKYNKEGKLIYEGFDDDRGNNLVKEYFYDNHGLLIESTEKINYSNLRFTYEYDSKNRLLTKYNCGFIEVTYEYSDNLLIREKYQDSKGTIVTYDYEENDLMTRKTENTQILRKETFYKGKILELWEVYSGPDPCEDLCCGKRLVKYGYY